MQQRGKIRHIGLSEVTPAEIEECEKIVPIVTVQNRYSLADRRHEGTLEYCERRGIGLLPWYPYAGGKLLKPGHPAAQALGRQTGHMPSTVSESKPADWVPLSCDTGNDLRVVVFDIVNHPCQ